MLNNETSNVCYGNEYKLEILSYLLKRLQRCVSSTWNVSPHMSSFLVSNPLPAALGWQPSCAVPDQPIWRSSPPIPAPFPALFSLLSPYRSLFFVFVHACVVIRVCVSIYVSMCAFTHVCSCMYSRTYVCSCIHPRMCVHVGMCIHACVHVCRCVFMYVCICACMCVFMYVCVYVFVFIQLSVTLYQNINHLKTWGISKKDLIFFGFLVLP